MFSETLYWQFLSAQSHRDHEVSQFSKVLLTGVAAYDIISAIGWDVAKCVISIADPGAGSCGAGQQGEAGWLCAAGRFQVCFSLMRSLTTQDEIKQNWILFFRAKTSQCHVLLPWRQSNSHSDIFPVPLPCVLTEGALRPSAGPGLSLGTLVTMKCHWAPEIHA